MKKIYITGISGTGKTTIAKELNGRGIHAIDVDNICCWEDKESREIVEDEVELNKEFIDSHNWICDIENLKKLMEKDGDVVVALGSASNQRDYINLFDKVLLLQCSPETFIKRIESRDNNDFGKDKTAQESILGWYEEYERKMLDEGAISIDVEKPIEEVIEQVLKQIT